MLRQWGAELLGKEKGSPEQQVKKRALGRPALSPLSVSPLATCGAEGQFTQELQNKTAHTA